MTIDKLIIHCSASPPGRGDSAETIHAWHLARGWSGIGYHWIILENGTLQAGRPEYWIGAHLKNYNAHSIGVCLIGDDEFTEEQYSKLKKLVKRKQIEYPGIDILGHYQLTTGKTCPNFDVPGWLEEEGLN